MTCTTRTEDVPVLNVSFLPCKINCGNHQVANLKIIMNNNDRKETVYFELFISFIMAVLFYKQMAYRLQ